MKIADALNYVEHLLPGTVDHKIAAAEQIVKAHKAEFVRATSQLSALATQSAQLESYLDTVNLRIDAAEHDLAQLTTPTAPTPPAAQAAPLPSAGVVTKTA